MKDSIKIAWCYIEVLYTNILRLIGIKKSTKPIPKNTPYCYSLDNNRNEKEPISGVWIKKCKYYRNANEDIAACTYVGFIGFDLCLYDQCKICGIGDNSEI